MKARARLAAYVLCSGLSLAHPIQPPLTSAEKKLVCGVKGKSSERAEGWSEVPANQALFELRGFLQARGYLVPRISGRPGAIVVDPGAVTRARGIRLEGESQGIDPSKKRHVLGRRLTPKLLNEVESWVKDRLSQQGYPCPEVKATGGADGVLKIGIKKGPLATVRSVGTYGLSSLDPGVLRRYDAFTFGSPYNSDLLAISADRAVESGEVERSFFTPSCPGGAPLQISSEGKPRIFSLGMSFNTEEVGILQASLVRTRIGRNASSAGASALASFKRQEITAFYDWHFESPESRMSLRPEIEGRHENEDPYELYSERAELGYVTSWEALGAGMKLVAGPQFEYFESRRGSPEVHPYATTLAARLEATGHEYEFNRNRLGGGFRLRSSLQSGDQAFLSEYGATELRVKAEEAWNLGGFDPSACILTIRGGYAASFIQGGPSGAGGLPPNAFQYLGGDSDVRGFGRLELGRGYPDESLSSAFGALELSPDLLPDFLGKPLRPLAFVDAGLLSYQSYTLASPVFWSPGIGVAWYSPLGTLRSTVARGIISGAQRSPDEEGLASSHWQFFLSLGEPL